MKQFEVGKRYKEEEYGTEIEVIKRTAKTISFKYIKPWLYVDREDEDKTFRKKIQTYNKESECIELDSHWSAPNIYAM